MIIVSIIVVQLDTLKTLLLKRAISVIRNAHHVKVLAIAQAVTQPNTGFTVEFVFAMLAIWNPPYPTSRRLSATPRPVQPTTMVTTLTLSAIHATPNALYALAL